MRKIYKADIKKRDWLLSQTETLVLNHTHCLYKNEMYVYKKVSKKEILKNIKEIRSLLKTARGQ